MILPIFHKLFKHKPTLRELWKSRAEAFLVGAGVVLFWRGIWLLGDLYIFPGHPNISATASLFIGMGLLILMRSFVNEFLDDAVEEASEFE